MDAGKGWRGKSMGDRCKVQLNSARISSRAKGARLSGLEDFGLVHGRCGGSYPMLL